MRLFITVDYELFWGVHDSLGWEKYKENILGASSALLKIVEITNKYNVKLSIACVGMLMEDKEIDFNLFENQNLIPKKALCAKNEIIALAKYDNCEIGSHTFSHSMLDEKSEIDIIDDIRKTNDLLRNSCRFHVFPRNKFSKNAYNTYKDSRNMIMRSIDNNWIDKKLKNSNNNLFKKTLRFLRFIDSFINLSGHNPSIPDERYTSNKDLWFSSKYYRCSESRILNFLRNRRIYNSILSAIKKNKDYHFWFHPHNFGSKTEIHLKSFENLLKMLVVHVENNQIKSTFFSES
jgi:hypothetical protein